MTITTPLEHKQARTPPAPLGGQARGERPHTPVASARLFSIQQPQAGAGNAEREAGHEDQRAVGEGVCHFESRANVGDFATPTIGPARVDPASRLAGGRTPAANVSDGVTSRERPAPDPKIIRPRFGARPRLAFHQHPSVTEAAIAVAVAAECIRRSRKSIEHFEKSVRQLPSCSTDNGAGQWKKIFDRAGRISP